MQKTNDPAQLAEIAKRVRRDIVTMIAAAKSGHPGGSLSATEILVTLYFDVMRHDPANPKWADRDRFVLGKGHACPVLYAVMAETGYTPPDQLNTLRRMASMCALFRLSKHRRARSARACRSGSAWRWRRG
jgi:transketolase